MMILKVECRPTCIFSRDFSRDFPFPNSMFASSFHKWLIRSLIKNVHVKI